MSTERFVVDEAVADVFVARFAERVNALETGLPAKSPACVIGPMIGQGSVQRINHLLDDAVNKGAKIVTGGLAESALMGPTLLDCVTREMAIYDEETFGPVTTIVRVKGPSRPWPLPTTQPTVFHLRSSAVTSPKHSASPVDWMLAVFTSMVRPCKTSRRRLTAA